MEDNESMECSQEDLEEYLNGIPYYVYVKDSEDKVIFANELFKNRVDQSDEQIINQNVVEALNVGSNNYKINLEGKKENLLFTEKFPNFNSYESWDEDAIVKFINKADILNPQYSYDIVFRNTNIQKKIFKVITKYIKEIIEDNIDKYNANITEKAIFNELINLIKQELGSQDVFFLLYNINEKKFVNYRYNKIENNIGNILNDCIVNSSELTSENIKKILINNYFGDKCRLNVCVEEIIESILGIMIYKDKIYEKYDVYIRNVKQYFIDTICKAIKLITRTNMLYLKLDSELQKRKESELELKQFIEIATDLCCIVKIKDNDHIVMGMTDSWRNLIGDFEKIINVETYKNYIHKDDLNKYKKELIDKVHNHIEVGKTHILEVRVKIRNSYYRNIQWKWKYTHDGIFIMSGNDVTNEKIFQQQKLKLEKNIDREKINKQFFTNLSFQFKNPINVIISALQLLESYIRDNKLIPCNKVKNYIDIIEKNSYMLLKWSNDLIEISKLESKYNEFTIEKINIIEEIENIVDYTNQHFNGRINNIIFDTVSEEIFTGCDIKKTEKAIFIILDELIRCSHKKANIKVNIINNRHDYVDIFFSSDKYLIYGKRLDEAIASFYNDTDSYMVETGGESTKRLRLSLLKKNMKLFNGKLVIKNNKKNILVKLSIPIIDLDDESEVLNEKILNSLAEKCNIEYSDIY